MCQIKWQHMKKGVQVNLNLFILNTQLEQFVAMFNVGKYQKVTFLIGFRKGCFSPEKRTFNYYVSIKKCENFSDMSTSEKR